MKEIAVVGNPEFTLGFRLAGIRIVVDDVSQVASLFSNATIGVVIMQEEIFAGLDPRVREDVVSSLDPVFVVLSKETRQDELRKMIIQSIGVDLMKEN
ncbi:V-type ATP synthase subunit F [Candidatus Woesearchaeota archaeon]|nr:V-type ATP synthase subunit F [Candidatus Woesearchaeota archaeon]